MRYTPMQKNKHVVAYVAVLLSLAGIAYLSPRITSAYGAYVNVLPFNILAVFFVIAALYLILRYIAVGFMYVIEPRTGCEELCPPSGVSSAWEIVTFGEYYDFMVVRLKMGRQSGAECVFSLGELVCAVPFADGKTKKEAREKFGKMKIYDYTVTLGAVERMLLVFADGDGYTGVLVEPDSILKALLESAVSKRTTENGG